MRVSSGGLLLAEKTFFVLLLFFMSGSIFPFDMGGYTKGGHESVGAVSNHYLWVIFGASYALTSLLLFHRRVQAVKVVRSCPWIMLLLLFVCTSVIWSTAPELTLRRSVAFLGTNVVGLYLATRFSLREILNLLIGSFCIAMVCSLTIIAFWPGYGINPEPHAGAWRGIFAQKNGFGIYCSFFYIVFLVHAATSRYGTKFIFLLLGLASCSLFIYKSDSRTALVIQFFLLLSYVLLVLTVSGRRSSLRQWIAVAGLSILTLAPFSVSILDSHIALDSHAASAADGADTSHVSKQAAFKTSDINTLNGRTIIWSEVINQAKKRPMVGYGYIGRTWPPPPHSGKPYKKITSRIKKKMNFYAPHPHNGYLRLFLALGGGGLLIFFIAIADISKNFVFAIKRFGIQKENLFAGLFLAWFLGINVLETYMASQNLIYWPMLIVAAVASSCSRMKTTQCRKHNNECTGRNVGAF